MILYYKQSARRTRKTKTIMLFFLSVLEAKRTSKGPAKVVGRIVGRSTIFKVIAKSDWKCQHFECNNRGSSFIIHHY